MCAYSLLPRDMWGEIFKRAWPKDKFNGMKVCKDFRALMKTEPGIWGQLKLEVVNYSFSSAHANWKSIVVSVPETASLTEPRTVRFLEWLEAIAPSRPFTGIELERRSLTVYPDNLEKITSILVPHAPPAELPVEFSTCFEKAMPARTILGPLYDRPDYLKEIT